MDYKKEEQELKEVFKETIYGICSVIVGVTIVAAIYYHFLPLTL